MPNTDVPYGIQKKLYFVKKSRFDLLKLLYIVYEYVPDAIDEQESTNTAATYELQVPKQKKTNKQNS
jgi:hypothetical protein